MRKITLIFILFLVAQLAYLHRVPGLLGDEASEGENVYQLLQSETLPIIGERSYIGVITDYIRVPFIWVFGYSVLALRIPMLIASVGFFFVAYALLQKYFGDHIGSITLVFLTFSPIYIVYQRLGWAITLLPVFTVLLAYALQSNWKYKWLISGLVAGIGLQTHLLFFPSMVAVAVAMLLVYLVHSDVKKRMYELRNLWQSFVGFWFGFGLQFAIMRFMTEDQGDPSKTTQLFGERLHDLWVSLPVYLSGSSFVAQYTGAEFSSVWIFAICSLLALLIVVALLFVRKRAMYVIALFVIIHTPILLYMIDRYSLRYFVMLCLALWLLAGIGFGYIVEKILQKYPRLLQAMPFILALFLTIWMMVAVLMPFLKIGGSINQFSLGNRTTSANAFLNDRALIACLRGKGPVFSEREPIQNILLYRSHQYSDLLVVDEAHKKEAQWVVSYQDPKNFKETTCPEAKYFLVTQRSL
ncbi:MAG: hypothetical protein A3C02_03075 [Candidatus Andersenbacteria bacterium RIFCSPHIGHO2_02_FULL_45_11]|uniref:Glycosyltransferase RgtA/B/C/D-like domain-containing protein n=1 Tax=Candidatus Andersenbacteria bacterium RIFCSPHIGHO2_12_FULL_45_11 TaxID=1797281 RepID=A0A1G1X0Q7_9BACT|nr:MAG: hypothetical protein A3C02_03075 [Candidatus Andersenbacteria bacterium RIFCSPHIGHO2_02_FULL_45_11]OGY33589.1 MAG: hypothetical protein A3D99_00020 [Candidatus Andersenbacteria bacterium RIFCSPHIGHO2_12_FULL_45_11]